MELLIWIDAAFTVHHNMTSRTGAIITLHGGAVGVWSSKQKMVTLHSTESEVVGMTDYLQRGTWHRMFVSFIMTISKETIEPTIVYQDNQSCISLMDPGP
jgi:hypothetical protein